jgi:hypothetical protein
MNGDDLRDRARVRRRVAVGRRRVRAMNTQCGSRRSNGHFVALESFRWRTGSVIRKAF